MDGVPVQRSALSYYGFSGAVSIAAVALGGVLWGPQAALTVAILTVLEISLSLDNAVVNARILENWNDFWRKLFLTVGILVAVFGMRLLFPILVVVFATGMGPVEVTQMALNNPDRYAQAMLAAHYGIAGFGGAFLLMVALSFFFEERDQHWFEWAERKLTRLGQMEGVSVGLTLLLLFGAQQLMPAEHRSEFFTAGCWGLVTFVFAHGLSSLVGPSEEEGGSGTKFVRQGVAGFAYIELLDASFSFDGVIGAFAITKYLPIIMLGLGAGAFFVRSITLQLVEKGTLAEYRYLESGAFYAILMLAGIMLVPAVHLPEWFVGLSGAAILLVAVLHSIHANKREAAA